MQIENKLNTTEIGIILDLYLSGHKTHVIAQVMGVGELNMLSQLSSVLPFTHTLNS